MHTDTDTVHVVTGCDCEACRLSHEACQRRAGCIFHAELQDVYDDVYQTNFRTKTKM